ncbi:MAG: VOC family protein [Candidatus Sulfotelmatobacter sp.]|jgi:catechol 2,3-dioxygenase-like lactoylglutathione lyase family enzyme
MRCFLAVILMTSSLFAQADVPRPHILGLAHVAIRVSDIVKTSTFYENLLGYAPPFSLTDKNGRVTMATVKINDQQYVELLQGAAHDRGRLDHFALYTDDLAPMREYLLAQQVPILADVHKGRMGNPFLVVRDPSGYQIEIVQYLPNSLTYQSHGKFMPPNRISSHIDHVGIQVTSMERAVRFYEEVLGFRETSHGSNASGETDRVELRTPDGSDSIELLSPVGEPLPSIVKAQNHFCLTTSDVRQTVAILQTRAVSSLTMSPITVQSGDNLPIRANLSDPDGARIEIMELARD